MSVVELGECSRLAARISPEQCQKNRKSGTFACAGCVGLNNTRLVAYQPIEHDPNPLEPEALPRSIIIVDHTINEEITDMAQKTTPRGTCPVCKRENVLLPGPKCHRCYGRARKGLDALTGDPATSETPAKAQKPAPAPAPVAEQPAPGPNPPARAATTARDVCSVDIVAHLDSVWTSKRASWIRELTESPNISNRLLYAGQMIKALEELGY